MQFYTAELKLLQSCALCLPRNAWTCPLSLRAFALDMKCGKLLRFLAMFASHQCGDKSESRVERNMLKGNRKTGLSTTQLWAHSFHFSGFPSLKWTKERAMIRKLSPGAMSLNLPQLSLLCCKRQKLLGVG